MELEVPEQYRFDVPEGNHAVTFYDHCEKTKIVRGKIEQYIRLRFKVDALSKEGMTMLVCKNFPPTLKQNGDLRSLLEMWLGDVFIDKHTIKRKFDFNSLNELKGDAVVGRIANDDYKNPFVYLGGLYPRGTLVPLDPAPYVEEGI